MPKAKTQSKTGEATVVTTLRITTIMKVSNDQEKALDEINAAQKKLLQSIKSKVDNLELINERKFLNLKDE